MFGHNFDFLFLPKAWKTEDDKMVSASEMLMKQSIPWENNFNFSPNSSKPSY